VKTRTRAEPAGAPRVQTLHPGDVAFGERGDRLETLLGSCVAIILTDPRRTMAVMCHVVHARLPTNLRQHGDTAFGEVAMAEMAGLLIGRGLAPSRCEAYVVGGGNMFPQLVTQAPVGEANARWALAALARENVRVVYQDLGGAAYRKLGWTVGHNAPDIVAVPA
jgi:chemotaxis protein CheD